MLEKHMFFKYFLVVYLGALLSHSFSIEFDSWVPLLSLTMGFGFALVAHTNNGVITVVLLLIHMGLEWTEYAKHSMHFSTPEIAMHTVHATMDFIFLYKELETHTKGLRTVVISSAMFVLATVIIVGSEGRESNPYMMIAHSHNHHKRNNGPIEPFVTGGMLGCVIYHLRKQK